MFDKFVLAHYDTVHRYANRLCPDKALAEDCTQQCIVKLYDGFTRGHPRTAGELTVSYAIRALVSVAIDHFRKESRERRALEEVERSLAGKSADDPGKRVADRAHVLRFLQELPMRQQEVYFLTKVGGYTAAEVGEILGLATGTVSNYLSIAQKRMAQLRSRK
jgi:RNA polymerase sigma factor (sigma-70 family)